MAGDGWWCALGKHTGSELVDETFSSQADSLCDRHLVQKAAEWRDTKRRIRLKGCSSRTYDGESGVPE